MKFKSNVKVTQEAPVNFEDLMQDMDNVLNMELEEAVEHLEDLTILEQNISKYGVTEPVMHLVGGTLESWSIDISNKEACLEGIGDKLKEAGKKVWEMILKIFAKVRDYIKGFMSKFGKEKLVELEKEVKGEKVDLKEIKAGGLVPSKYIDAICKVAASMDRNVKGAAEWDEKAPMLFERNQLGEISIAGKFFNESGDDTDLASKGYTNLEAMVHDNVKLADSVELLEKVADYCAKEAESQLKASQSEYAMPINERLRKEYTNLGRIVTNLAGICTRSIRTSNSICKKAGF